MKHLKGIVFFGMVLGLMNQAVAAEPLSLWNDTPAKQQIIKFVNEVSTDTNPVYLPPENRVVIFNNSGTLWAENPMDFQLQFAVDQLKNVDASTLSWLTDKQIESLIRDPVNGIKTLNPQQLTQLIAFSRANKSVEEYRRMVSLWLTTAKDTKFNCALGKMVYAPMVELVNYLKQAGFKVYILAGTGTDFVRVFSDRGGISAVQVIDNTSIKKEVSTQQIEKFLKDQPIIAIGNSDGDLEMLQYTSTNTPSLPIILRHTDGQREWEYNRNASFGTQDKLLDYGQKNGWLIIDMKTDFKQLFIGCEQNQ
ncbi:MAG: HAD family hydrolase [Legionella sp.]|nr:HAD family hydrolase [Legionella sp.]